MTDTTADTLAEALARHRYQRFDSHFSMPGGFSWEAYKVEDPQGADFYLNDATDDVAALAPVVAAQVEAARAEAVASALALADEWERHTATPGISLYAAVRDLRAAVTPEGVAAHNRAERAAAWDECVAASRERGYLARTRDDIMRNPYRADALDHTDPEEAS